MLMRLALDAVTSPLGAAPPMSSAPLGTRCTAMRSPAKVVNSPVANCCGRMDCPTIWNRTIRINNSC